METIGSEANGMSLKGMSDLDITVHGAKKTEVKAEERSPFKELFMPKEEKI